MSKPRSLGSLKVGGFSYKVYLHSGELRAPDNDPVRGYCDNERHEIHLAGDLSAEALTEVFCHEVFHAVCNSYRLPFSYEQEEAIAGPVGLGFAQALAPWLAGKLSKPW